MSVVIRGNPGEWVDAYLDCPNCQEPVYRAVEMPQQLPDTTTVSAYCSSCSQGVDWTLSLMSFHDTASNPNPSVVDLWKPLKEALNEPLINPIDLKVSVPSNPGYLTPTPKDEFAAKYSVIDKILSDLSKSVNSPLDQFKVDDDGA